MRVGKISNGQDASASGKGSKLIIRRYWEEIEGLLGV